MMTDVGGNNAFNLSGKKGFQITWSMKSLKGENKEWDAVKYPNQNVSLPPKKIETYPKKKFKTGWKKIRIEDSALREYYRRFGPKKILPTKGKIQKMWQTAQSFSVL